jgi:hypothetical protein
MIVHQSLCYQKGLYALTRCVDSRRTRSWTSTDYNEFVLHKRDYNSSFIKKKKYRSQKNKAYLPSRIFLLKNRSFSDSVSLAKDGKYLCFSARSLV